MLRQLWLYAGLCVFAFIALGARCVNYQWLSGDDQARFGGAVWHDTPLADAEYHFEPDLPTTDRNVGFCYDDRFRPALVNRGGLACQSYVLDVQTPDGMRTITDIAGLLAIFGPIQSEVEAASFAKATIGGFAQYDGATAVVGDMFLVRMTDILDNCSATAGVYAVAYEVARDGAVRRVAEEKRRVGQGAVCYD